MRVHGKVALVTGANSHGIGRAIAIGLASEGADVAVNYVVDEAAAHEVVSEIRQMGRRAVAVCADISRSDQVSAMVTRVVEELGPIGCLVSNAAVISHSPFLETTEEMLDKVVAVNLKGTFLVGQAVARAMVAAGRGGSIVNLGSITAHKPSLGLGHYGATKGGIVALTRAMALELVPYGIRVNSVSPGTTLTDINRQKMENPEFYNRKVQRIPMQRLASPKEMVGAVLHFCSDESSFTTGIDLLVDGGIAINA